MFGGDEQLHVSLIFSLGLTVKKEKHFTGLQVLETKSQILQSLNKYSDTFSCHRKDIFFKPIYTSI